MYDKIERNPLLLTNRKQKGILFLLDYKYNYKYIITYSKLCGSSTTLTHEKECFHTIFLSFFPRQNGKLGNS